MFIFLNEREERKQGGNLEELKYLSSMVSAFFLFPRSKLLVLNGLAEVSNSGKILGT